MHRIGSGTKPLDWESFFLSLENETFASMQQCFAGRAVCAHAVNSLSKYPAVLESLGVVLKRMAPEDS